jgi:hypothetical protein
MKMKVSEGSGNKRIGRKFQKQESLFGKLNVCIDSNVNSLCVETSKLPAFLFSHIVPVRHPSHSPPAPHAPRYTPIDDIVDICGYLS